MAAVRAAPQSFSARMALIRLDCVSGDWERARAQLATLAALDAEAVVLARLCDRLIQSELEREEVFAGRTRPIVLGPPAAWLAMLAQALEQDAAGDHEAARRMRGQARAEAPARPGMINGTAFAWIMDADPRLGPALEVIVDGNYRWLPLEHVRWLRAEAPATLMDVVWQPVDLALVTGAEMKVFVPVRYPGSAKHTDDAVRLARVSLWFGPDENEQWGSGQRVLATERDDYPFLDVRRLEFESTPEATSRD